MIFNKETKLSFVLSKDSGSNIESQSVTIFNKFSGGTSSSLNPSTYVEGTTDPVVNNFYFKNKILKVWELEEESDITGFEFLISDLGENLTDLVELSIHCVMTTSDSFTLPIKFRLTIVKGAVETLLGNLSSFSLDNITGFDFTDIKIDNILMPATTSTPSQPVRNKCSLFLVALFK